MLEEKNPILGMSKCQRENGSDNNTASAETQVEGDILKMKTNTQCILRRTEGL